MMRWFVRTVLLLLVLACGALEAHAQTTARRVRVTGLEVNTPYFFAVRADYDAPNHAALHLLGGHHWPYLASLALVGVLWGVWRPRRRRD